MFVISFQLFKARFCYWPAVSVGGVGGLGGAGRWVPVVQVLTDGKLFP